MTSTNDGKEVKSYQTSGPKGKTYFIELYKSLEAHLNEATGSERTKHLCDAWRRVHNLCLHSALTAHTHLLSWLQRHTARTVLPVEWQLPDRKEDRASLEEAINVFIVESRSAAAGRDGRLLPWEEQLVARGEWFKSILDHPWKHPVLSCLLNPDGTPPTDDEVLKWLKEERGVTFVIRLHTLVAEKCDDIAMSLATAVMERVRNDSVAVSDVEQSEEPKEKPENALPTFGDKLREEAGFTVDVWEMLTDIEFVLLHKRDSIRCIALAKQTPLRSAYQLIERLQSRLETSPREKRLWKNSKEVAVLIAQVVVARCMVVPTCAGAVRSALYCCARSLARLTPRARLPAAAAALAAPAPTAAHLHTLAAAVDAQKNDPSMKPFVCELYVRAITAGMNELERLKLKTEKDTEARCMEATLASWFVQLGGVLASSDRVKCECALTAFSVHPSPPMYERIKAAPPLPPIHLDVEQKPSEATNPEFGSWASDSRGQSNFVKTSETLNMKARQNQANVLSTAILSEGEALGLSPELCQDITVLLSGPRVKTLSWDMDRELLLENCRAYLERTHGGTKAVTTELKYLNLNPDDFQYLPEEDEDESNIYYGIEKGYEHLVEFQEPEDIWEDAYEDVQNAGSSHSSDEFDFVQPQRRRRTKKTNTDEDDPLSFVAETKRKEKKERPHSKERSKERKKTEKKPSTDPLDISDGNQEKKEKQKRVRKKKVKPEGSLSSLVGLKVGKKAGKHTDSDADSQKSVRSVNSDVIYDGTFSMDEMRSPSSLSADMGAMQTYGRMGGDAYTNTSYNRPYRPQSVSGVRIASPSPSKSYSASEHSRNNSPTYISDEVKSSITKLIEYRRQKAIEERKKPNAIMQPDGSLPDKINISPKAVAIPEIPKSYINKQSDKISLLKQNVDSLLSHQPNEAVHSPVIQYASKVSPHKTQPHYGPSQYQNRMMPSDRCFSTPPSSDRFMNNVNLISIYDKGEPSPSRSAYKPPYSTAPRTDGQRTNDMSSLNYQDYLHEFSLQSYNKHMENSEETKKVMRPVSRVTPVTPHMKSETKTPQSAKQMQLKKPDGSLNTFSRLSYYKNKQTDIRKSQELPQSSERVGPTASSKLDGFIINHLRQSDSKPYTNQVNDYQLVKQYDKPQTTTRDHPLLTNILQGNTSRLSQEKPAGPMKMLSSDKDQNDLLLLLRQQKALNIHNTPVPTTKTYHSLNSPIASSSKAVTSTTDASIAASSLLHNAQIGNPNEPTKTVKESKVINVLSTSIIKAADQKADSIPKPHLKKLTQEKPKATGSRVSKNIKPALRKNPEEWENVMDAILKQKTPSRGPNALEMALNNTSFEKAFMDSLRNPMKLFTEPDNEPSVKAPDYNHETLKNTIKALTSTSLKIPKREKITKPSHNDLHNQSVPKKTSRSKKSSTPTVAELLKQRQEEGKMMEKLMQQNQIQITKRDTNVPMKITEPLPKHNMVNTKPTQQHLVAKPKTAAHQRDVQQSTVQPTTKTYLKSTIKDNSFTNTHTKQIAEQPKRDVHTTSGVQVKPHDVIPKQDDLFVSGIPNSDYDLLDALMDDDLRKEIGELSSDEESYTTTTPEYLKNTKTVRKQVSVPYNQSCESAPKPQISAISERLVCKERDTYVQMPTQTPLTNKEALKMTLKPTPTEPIAASNTTNTRVMFTKPIQNHNIHSSQVTVEPSVYISAAPRPPAPNVMLIPSGMMYEGYPTVQSTVQAVPNLAPNAYLAVSNAPSINLYQTTQFVAPVVSPLIIASAVASPVVNIVPFTTTVQQKPVIEEQNPSSFLNYDLQTARLAAAQGGMLDIDKRDDSSIPNATENEMQTTENKVAVDGAVGKTTERKVLKEVQEKHSYEKVESKRKTQKVCDKDIKIKTDPERVKRKRMAILNRKINYYCGIETIALGYSPLQLSTQNEDDNIEVTEHAKDDLVLSNHNNLQDQLREDIKSPATPDSYKENKSEPARRILLRSSNKLKGKINSPSTSPKHAVDKKYKGSFLISGNKSNETPSDNYQSPTQENNKFKRVSKRTLNKSITSKEINNTNIPSKFVKSPKTMNEGNNEYLKMSQNLASSSEINDTEKIFDIENEILGSTVPKTTPVIDSHLISSDTLDKGKFDEKETKTSSIQGEIHEIEDQSNEIMKSSEVNVFNATDKSVNSNTVINKTENSSNEVPAENTIKDVTAEEAITKDNNSVNIFEQPNVPTNLQNPSNDDDLDLEVVSEEIVRAPMQLQTCLSPKNISTNESTSLAKETEAKKEHSDNIKSKVDNKSNDIVPTQVDDKNVSTIELDDNDDIKEKRIPNSTLSKSFLDSVKIETMSSENKDPRVKTVRITLPNGKTFKGVISGTCSVENVLDNLSIKSHLVSQFQEKKKKYSMRLDVKKDCISILPAKVPIKEPQGPIETVSLLSDDEEDKETFQVFETEYGKHKIRTINKDLFNKHQIKLKQKISVSLEKLKEDENTIKCSKTRNKKNKSITRIVQETIVLSDIDAELHNMPKFQKRNIDSILSTIPSKYVDGVLSDVESILNPLNKQTVEEPIVVLDDSSDESDQCEPKPLQENINELKQKLFKDLGVYSLLSDGGTKDTRRNLNEGDKTEDYRKIINRKCYIKLVRCDDALKKQKCHHTIQKQVETVSDNKTDESYNKTKVNDEEKVDESKNEANLDAHEAGENKAVENQDKTELTSNEVIEKDDSFKEDDYMPSRISRSGSFSILEDFQTVDEENKVTAQQGRSSPVMEIYDLIASLKKKISIEKNIPDMFIHVNCHSEWTTTKKYEHMISGLKNEHELDRPQEVPKLADLLLSLIQKEDLVTRYTSAEQLQRYPTSQKRKSDPSLLPLAKISKLVIPSDQTNQNCNSPPINFCHASSVLDNNDSIMSATGMSEVSDYEDKKVIDDVDVTPDLSDIDVASTRGNTPTAELLCMDVAAGRPGNELLPTDKKEIQEKPITDEPVIMAKETDVPPIKEIFKDIVTELGDDIQIDCSAICFTIDEVVDTKIDTCLNTKQNLTTHHQAKDDSFKALSTVTDMVDDSNQIDFENQNITKSSFCNILECNKQIELNDAISIIKAVSEESAQDCTTSIFDTSNMSDNTDEDIEANKTSVDSSISKSLAENISDTCIEIEHHNAKITLADDKTDLVEIPRNVIIDEQNSEARVESPIHVQNDVFESKKMQDIDTKCVQIPNEVSIITTEIKISDIEEVESDKKILSSNVLEANDEIMNALNKMFGESEADVANIELDKNVYSGSTNNCQQTSIGCKQIGISDETNLNSKKISTSPHKVYTNNNITDVNSSDNYKIPKTNDEIDDALTKMFGEPEDGQVILKEVISENLVIIPQSHISTISYCENSVIKELNENDLSRKVSVENIENDSVVEGIVEMLMENVDDNTIASLKSNTRNIKKIEGKTVAEKCVMTDDYANENTIDPSSDVLSILNQYSESNGKIEIKGIEYEDPIVGTRYVFSVIKEVSDINEQDCVLSEVEENIEDKHQKEVDDFVLLIPKRTYSKHLSHRSLRNMKRKKDMTELKTSERKYRKGKHIDHSNISASAIAELAYAKEYKRIIDYCSTIKFSYAIPFHIESIDVSSMLKSWPLNMSSVEKETSDLNEEVMLFKDPEESESAIASNPFHQTLSDEILNGENISKYQSIDINETNFNKGFGERSGRVIQKIETGFTKLSAATLSDVKQYQPFSMSDARKVYPCIAHEMDSTKDKLWRFSNVISMKEKVRSFFKNTTVELNKEWLQDKKNTASEFHLNKFPFGLTSPDFMHIPSVESVVNVVQVGQLPVTAAAQNPVTCDPRVTHVSDASPSQCSDNSPGIDTQASVETEYTELTTANITLPLVQEYAQNRQQSQEKNSPENVEVVNGSSQSMSIVKIELMEEETSQEKLENEIYENDFSPLPTSSVEYSFEDTSNNLFNPSGNLENPVNTGQTSKTNIFHANSSMESTFNNIFNNTANVNNGYSHMDTTPSSDVSTYTNMENASSSMYSTSPNMRNSSNEIENTTNIGVTSPNESATHIDNNTNMADTYTNSYPVASDSKDVSNISVDNVASTVTSPMTSENKRIKDASRTSNVENTSFDYSYENIEDFASNMEHNNNADYSSQHTGVDNYANGVNNYSSNVDEFTSNVDYAASGENYTANVDNYPSNVDNYASNIQNYSTNVDNYSTSIENSNSNTENNDSNIDNTSASLSEEPQDLSITNPIQEPKISNKFEETTASKVNQIKNAMTAAGIPSNSVITSSADVLANLIGQSTQATASNYTKSTPINVMTLQQALAQVLPPPLNQTSTSENQVPSNPVSQQVLHIVQGSNAQTVINKPNGTHLLHIVQNKSNPGSGLSLVDTGLQQGGNQLIHIVNNGNQNNAQFLKRVNLLTNLTNAQGSNEQKMIQFVCKSADGKSIQLNTGHQRSMVLRLHPTTVQTTPKPAESQDVSGPTSAPNSANNQDSAQEIKSRSMYEENYAQFIQNTGPTPGTSGGDTSTSPCLEKATSLPKFNQVFGKQSYQENQSEMDHNGLQENSECPPEESTSHLEQTPEVNNPPLLVRNTPPETTQAQTSPAQQIKQTISPMNIHTTMHGGVIYTRQIPVNIGGGQTINLITVPSTELVDDSPQKQQTDGSFVNQESEQSSIIKLVSHHATNKSNTPQEENNTQTGRSNEPNSTPQPPSQPVLTQMRIKLPMISKGPHLVPGARIVRPSFFQIQRNVIAGTNPPVYQQVVLATAPPLGQTIRLPAQAARSPQTQPILVQTSQHAQPSPHIPVQQVQHAPSSQHLSTQQSHVAPPTPQPQPVTQELSKPDTEPDSELSTLTLEQLREFDMVLEQVKERSVQPTPSTTPKTKPTPADSTDGSSLASTSSVSESSQQVHYSTDNSQPSNVASYVSRKSTITSATTSFARSPDSTAVTDTPSSSTKVQVTHTVTSKSATAEGGSAPAPHPKKKKKKKPSSSSSALSSMGSPSKTNALKPQEDEQTTQRILYILAEYKEQVENSPDKNKPAPRRRNQFPPTIGSKRKRSHCSSRATCRREGVDMSPLHGEQGEIGDDSLITLGSEDSSCGTTFSECTDCQETHSPEDSTKVVRRLTFEQETTTTQITQTQTIPPRSVVVGDRQTITVARTTTATTPAKPTTTVLMPANYLLPVSMLKGGQQIAIMTNRGPKILLGDSNAGALLLQRLIGPGMKPVLARSGVRHIRLPTTSLHNLQGFNIQTTPVTQVQPPDSTAHQAPTPTPPDLVDTRAMSSPWQDREAQEKPERGPSPDCTEPWNLPSSSIADDYGYEEIVRTDNMERTVLDAIPDRYSPDMEAQRIFDKMFDVDSKKSMYDSSRCGYDIDTSDGDDKPYPQVVQQRKDGRHHRVTHVSTAALRHKYAILEHELRLQKSLSEECEDLGVDSPSASDLFPEADILFGAPSPAHEQTIDQCPTPPPIPSSQTIPQPDLDDQIATDQLLTQNGSRNDDLDLNLDDVGEIVTVGEDGVATIPTINAEEFARSHPNTTFHTEPEDGEIPPFTIAQSIKGRHITFHANRVPGTVVMAPQTTVISQATVNSNDTQNTVKFIDIDNMINSMPCPQPVQSVLVKDPITKPVSKFDSLKDSAVKSTPKFDSLKEGTSHKTSAKFDSLKDIGHSAHKSSSKFDSLKDPSTQSQRPFKSSSKFDIKETKSSSKFDSLKEGNSAPKALSKFDSLLTDTKPHQSNTPARQVVHSTGHGAQVIRRLRYDERPNTRTNNRFHFEQPKRTSISDEVKMRNDRAIVESMGDNASSPGQPELYWDSTSNERSERRFNFSESEKVAKSPFDELLNDSSAYGPHTRLDSVIKAARPERTFERTSFEGISVSGSSEESRPLRTYPAKRVHTQHTQDSDRHFSLKSTTHHHDTKNTHRHDSDRNKKGPRCQESEGRRRTGRGLVKRGCSCCNGSSAPPKKRSRPKKPCSADMTPTTKSDTVNLT